MVSEDTRELVKALQVGAEPYRTRLDHLQDQTQQLETRLAEISTEILHVVQSIQAMLAIPTKQFDASTAQPDLPGSPRRRTNAESAVDVGVSGMEQRLQSGLADVVAATDAAQRFARRNQVAAAQLSAEVTAVRLDDIAVLEMHSQDLGRRISRESKACERRRRELAAERKRLKRQYKALGANADVNAAEWEDRAEASKDLLIVWGSLTGASAVGLLVGFAFPPAGLVIGGLSLVGEVITGGIGISERVKTKRLLTETAALKARIEKLRRDEIDLDTNLEIWKRRRDLVRQVERDLRAILRNYGGLRLRTEQLDRKCVKVVSGVCGAARRLNAIHGEDKALSCGTMRVDLLDMAEKAVEDFSRSGSAADPRIANALARAKEQMRMLHSSRLADEAFQTLSLD